MNMSNFSTEENGLLLPPYNETYWIISEVILIPTTLLCLYYLKSLVSYLRTKKGKKNRGQLKLLLVLNIIATILALGRFAADQVVAVLGWRTDNLCFYSVSVSFELYSASISPVYIFLWTRQHSFYSNKQLQTINNRKIIVIGYACLALLIVGWITLSVVYVLPSVTGWQYVASQEGCRDINDEQDVELLPILVFLIAGLGQLSLLALLLYPLLKYRTKNTRMNSSSNTPTHTNKKPEHPSAFRAVPNSNGTHPSVRQDASGLGTCKSNNV